MFESDSSDSTDSDNNNVFPFYNPYLRMHRANLHLEVLSSSDSESDSSIEEHPLQFFSSTSSSENDAQLCNSSEDLDHLSDVSQSESLVQSTYTGNIKNNRVAPKTSSENFLHRLYKREIGDYNNCAKWSNKFYQSVVTVQKLKLSKQLKEHHGCVNSLDFNYSGNIIVSGSDDCKICLWNWAQGKCIIKYNSEHSANIFQTKFLITQGDNHIISSARDGRVALYTLNNTDVIYHNTIARHEGSCNKLGVHSELPYVVLSCGEDGIVKNIDIRESDFQKVKVTNVLNLRNAPGNIMAIYGIDINPIKPWEFIIYGDDEYVRMYDKRHIPSGPAKIFRRPSTIDDNGYASRTISHITSAVYSYCGTEILASYSEDDIYLFDANGSPETCLHHYTGHLNRMTVKGVNFFGPRSDYVVSGSDCGYIFMWDKNTEVIVQRKHADIKGVVNVLEAHPHLPTLATSGLDHTIKIWEPLNTWHQLNRKKLKSSLLKNQKERDRRAPSAYHQDLFLF